MDSSCSSGECVLVTDTRGDGLTSCMDTTTDHFTPLALRVRGNYCVTIRDLLLFNFQMAMASKMGTACCSTVLMVQKLKFKLSLIEVQIKPHGNAKLNSPFFGMSDSAQKIFIKNWHPPKEAIYKATQMQGGEIEAKGMFILLHNRMYV